MRRGLALVLLALVALVADTARAQSVEELVRQLTSDADYKVRLSAALSLGRMKDRRTIPALVRALSDDVASIRAVAAGALSQVIDRTVPAEQRTAASNRLGEIARGDADSGARMAAGRALEALAVVERLAKPRALAGAVYVSIEPLKAEPGMLSEAAQAELSAAARDAFLLAHETAIVDWPGGKAPSPAELTKAKVRGAFTLMPSLSGLTVGEQGKQTSVSCQLKVILASYPSRAVRAFFSGGAKVTGPRSADGVEGTKVRCVKDLLSHLSKKELASGIDAAAAKEGR